ncbi:MAG TPA: hypothetical protein VD794_02200 [Flavisolibacter sp.]|nr:hypothetical protein [Flavisolibacter sp.]
MENTLWLSFEQQPLEQGDALKHSATEEIIGYHPDWIDEDYNENGTRVGIIDMDGKFHCAKWCDIHDEYEDCVCDPPTHYQFISKSPR